MPLGCSAHHVIGLRWGRGLKRRFVRSPPPLLKGYNVGGKSQAPNEESPLTYLTQDDHRPTSARKIIGPLPRPAGEAAGKVHDYRQHWGCRYGGYYQT